MSLKIAEIVPLKFLELTKDNQYHMCLAQLALASEEYRDFYRRMSDEGKYVIVDNGACEGESLSDDDLMTVYDMINPTEIILPDVLKDAGATVCRSINFYKKVATRNYNIMIVPQGEDLLSWIGCAKVMANEIPHNCIGIPKWLGSIKPANRMAAALCVEDLTEYIHLLGCSEAPVLVHMCNVYSKRVRSCDSAFAYLCSKAKYEHINGTTRRPDEKIDFLNDTEGDDLERLLCEFEDAIGGLR